MLKTEYSNISQYMVNTKGPVLAEWDPLRWMEIIYLANFTENTPKKLAKYVDTFLEFQVKQGALSWF